MISINLGIQYGSHLNNLSPDSRWQFLAEINLDAKQAIKLSSWEMLPVEPDYQEQVVCRSERKHTDKEATSPPLNPSAFLYMPATSQRETLVRWDRQPWSVPEPPNWSCWSRNLGPLCPLEKICSLAAPACLTGLLMGTSTLTKATRFTCPALSTPRGTDYTNIRAWSSAILGNFYELEILCPT